MRRNSVSGADLGDMAKKVKALIRKGGEKAREVKVSVEKIEANKKEGKKEVTNKEGG